MRAFKIKMNNSQTFQIECMYIVRLTLVCNDLFLPATITLQNSCCIQNVSMESLRLSNNLIFKKVNMKSTPLNYK